MSLIILNHLVLNYWERSTSQTILYLQISSNKIFILTVNGWIKPIGKLKRVGTRVILELFKTAYFLLLLLYYFRAIFGNKNVLVKFLILTFSTVQMLRLWKICIPWNCSQRMTIKIFEYNLRRQWGICSCVFGL